MPTLDLRPAMIDAIRTRYRPGVRGCGVRAIARELSLPRQPVQRVVDCIEAGVSGEPRPRGRKQKLMEAEERRMGCAARQQP